MRTSEIARGKASPYTEFVEVWLFSWQFTFSYDISSLINKEETHDKWNETVAHVSRREST